MDKSQFLEKMVEILDVEGNISENTLLTDIEEWDSLSIVSFLAFANTMGKKLSPHDVLDANTIGDLYILLH